MQASAAQFPSKIGKRAASAVYQLLDGEKLEKVISIPVEILLGAVSAIILNLGIKNGRRNVEKMINILNCEGDR